MEELDNIQNHIYVIRGQRVMFDFDLASIYQVETKVLNQAVKRNPKRFEGDEFMFQLTKEEWRIFTNRTSSLSSSIDHSSSPTADYNLRSQIVTSRFSDKWGGNRRPPYAFTEIGVAMLSSVLKKVLVHNSMPSALLWQNYRPNQITIPLDVPLALFSQRMMIKQIKKDWISCIT